MQLQAFLYMFTTTILSSLCKEEPLPLCPTDVNYLPQSLPMHCRMPRHADYPMFPGPLPQPNFTFPPLPLGFQSLTPDKQSPQMPVPIAAALPRAAPIPVPMQVPMMPMTAPATAHKLPVIVMPFYSPDGTRKLEPAETGRHSQRKKKKRINRKRKPRHRSDTDSGTDASDGDDWGGASHDSSAADFEAGWWEGRRSGKRPDGKGARKRRKRKNKKALLQPILQYVTEDGYVIYEKKISKNQANDWLQDKERENTRDHNERTEDERRVDGEENNALQEADLGPEEARGGKGADSKVDDEQNITKIKSHKNPHRRKSKKTLKDKDEK